MKFRCYSGEDLLWPTSAREFWSLWCGSSLDVLCCSWYGLASGIPTMPSILNTIFWLFLFEGSSMACWGRYCKCRGCFLHLQLCPHCQLDPSPDLCCSTLGKLCQYAQAAGGGKKCYAGGGKGCKRNNKASLWPSAGRAGSWIHRWSRPFQETKGAFSGALLYAQIGDLLPSY